MRTLVECLKPLVKCLLFLIVLCVAGCAKEVQFDDVTEPEPIGVLETIIGFDGAEMIRIPAGEFRMGTVLTEVPQLVEWAKEWYPKGTAVRFIDETPRHTVYLDAFYMDVYEVTNAQYREFVKATGHREPEGYGIVDGKSPKVQIDFNPWKDSRFNSPQQPVVCVSWEDAMAYCEWAGKRLPTEAEWEKAARGGLVGRKYPWGDEEPDGTRCNFADKNTDFDWSDKNVDDGYQYTAPVGSFASNGYGLYDMAGNVWEWVANWYDSGYYANSPRQNPKGPNVGSWRWRVLRGGSWLRDPYFLRVADRNHNLDPWSSSSYCGFRCAQDQR